MTGTGPPGRRGRWVLTTDDTRASAMEPPATTAGDERASDGPVEERPDSLGKRFLSPQTLVSFGLALALAIFFIRRLEIDSGAVWDNARNANPFLFGLAFVIFYLGFIPRALRWRAMLARAGISPERGYAVPGTRGLVEIYLLSWFANCVVPAKLGDAYRSYLLKRASKASFSTTLGTILAERLIDLAILFVAMVGAALVVFGTHQPGQARQTFAGGGALILAGGIGVLVMWKTRERFEGLLPERFRQQYARLHDGIFASLKRPQGFALVSLGIWLSEGLRLFLVATALGADITPATAIFVALLSSLLTAIPITPAGLGLVEGAMVVMLTLVDVEVSLAASIALMDRVIAYFSLIVVGLVLYVRRVRHDVL